MEKRDTSEPRGVQSVDDETFAQLAQAWDDYRPEQRRRLGVLTRAAARLRKERYDADRGQTISQEAHALGGAAAMYGFDGAKALTAELEELAVTQPVDSTTITRIRALVATLKETIDRPLPRRGGASAGPAERSPSQS